ncbi:E3 SUMO-protein ligase ZBED1-like isoform X1 [Acipenser ruthenus]|uniref:E3 SUMO-protein ligase ZBED1-like isoform X1 n=1 Tax=Acipenser ruthenus TaxID=7906 RepID=UPI002740858E|nr:E3 SUMO-protein ligase ZBED1-like isoform X1 [Acipenser ruthenus]XP_058874177.1 E3 SUMO-protein ligase ZBED1-like isoform X1 [Acipenser ruthenus]
MDQPHSKEVSEMEAAHISPELPVRWVVSADRTVEIKEEVTELGCDQANERILQEETPPSSVTERDTDIKLSELEPVPIQEESPVLEPVPVKPEAVKREALLNEGETSHDLYSNGEDGAELGSIQRKRRISQLEAIQTHPSSQQQPRASRMHAPPSSSANRFRMAASNHRDKERQCGALTSSHSKEKEELVPKKCSSSAVWAFFGFKSSDFKQSTILCKKCWKVVPAKGGNTSNLFHHLRHRHPMEYSKCIEKRSSDKPTKHSVIENQTPISESISNVAPYEPDSKRWKQITDAVTYFIAKDMVPIYTVEKEGFKKLLKMIDKKYQLPSRKYFSETALPALYDDCREQVAEALTRVQFFASTTDLWSSQTTEPYISLTVHYIDPDWKLCTKCLQTSYFPEDHTGEAIAQGLRDALSAWGLREELQICITTDSGSDVVKAAQLNAWERLQCFGHRLHLAIENSVKGDKRIDHAIGVCKKLVSTFSCSWKKRKALSVAQAELSLPQHQLVTETPTRWGSRQRMIQRVLEQEEAIAQVLTADRKTRNLVPTWQDADVLRSLNKALSPLVAFTDVLSCENYVSVSYVKPVLHLLNNNILAVEEDDTELTKSIKEKILSYLNLKYSSTDTQDLLDVSSFIDPRFKVQYISEDRVAAIKARVVSEVESLLQQDKSFAAGASNTETESQEAPAKKLKTLGSLFKANTSGPRASKLVSEKDKIVLELNHYLLSPLADSESDPLIWWKAQQTNFPRLCKLAQKYLCIPATSAACERVFSTCGNIVTCKQTRLKPDTVDKLVFLAKNI